MLSRHCVNVKWNKVPKPSVVEPKKRKRLPRRHGSFCRFKFVMRRAGMYRVHEIMARTYAEAFAMLFRKDNNRGFSIVNFTKIA